MSKLISGRKRIDVTSYHLLFPYVDSPGSGFAFDCDENGNVDVNALKLKPCAYANYVRCTNGAANVSPGVVETSHHSYTEPAVLRCDCGEHVYLDGFTNTCRRCAADYNMSGDRLADRSQWGEETGESWDSVLSHVWPHSRQQYSGSVFDACRAQMREAAGPDIREAASELNELRPSRYSWDEWLHETVFDEVLPKVMASSAERWFERLEAFAVALGYRADIERMLLDANWSPEPDYECPDWRCPS